MAGLFSFSMLAAFGFAVAIVEKGRTWPVRFLRINLYVVLKRLDPRLTKMLNCSVCLSFWTGSLFSLYASVITNHVLWFLLSPLVGFMTLGFTWIVYELLAAVDRKEPIVIQMPPSDNQNESH